MAKKSYRQAISEALRQEMERDHRVIVMGEDVAGGAGAAGEQDAWGGPLGVTKGLLPQFGRERVIDTPITESGFIGAAVGVVLPEWLRDVPYVANWYLPMFGVAVVLLMVWLPDGLLSIPDRIRAKREARAASSARAAAASRIGAGS